MPADLPDAPASHAAAEQSRDEAGLVHTSFYRFTPLPDADAVVDVLRDLVAPLTGSVLVAEEGISGALAGTASAIAAFEHAVQDDARLAGRFAGMPFKRSACATRPFWKVRVHRKREIVALGLPQAAPPQDAHVVSPEAWRALLQRDDVVVLDNRNHFEFRLGRFKGALDPAVPNFRDFPDFLARQAPVWKAQGKTVAMYCTGGIRCEKTGAWMQEALGLPVYQLDGGILNYFAAMPDAERDWEGECFVFDNRVAVDTRLQETPTTVEQVYDPTRPDEAWRLVRARRLDSVTPKGGSGT